jgi:hypothetical protein
MKLFLLTRIFYINLDLNICKIISAINYKYQFIKDVNAWDVKNHIIVLCGSFKGIGKG